MSDPKIKDIYYGIDESEFSSLEESISLKERAPPKENTLQVNAAIAKDDSATTYKNIDNLLVGFRFSYAGKDSPLTSPGGLQISWNYPLFPLRLDAALAIREQWAVSKEKREGALLFGFGPSVDLSTSQPAKGLFLTSNAGLLVYFDKFNNIYPTAHAGMRASYKPSAFFLGLDLLASAPQDVGAQLLLGASF